MPSLALINVKRAYMKNELRYVNIYDNMNMIKNAIATY